MSAVAPLRIRFAFPLLAQPQAVGGNLLVLADRARRRGIPVDVGEWHETGPLPAAELYVVGGAEDPSMALLAERLAAGGLPDAVRAGAAVLAVDVGYQVLGRSFETPDGERRDGLGLLEVTSTRGPDRVDGPVIGHGDPELGIGVLSGYETHRGRTAREAAVRPLATLELGVGNGDDPPSDGAVVGRVLGTYLHGPTLARNVELADLLLRWATGLDTLEPLDDSLVHELRDQHLAEERVDPTGWGGRVYGKKSILQRLPGPRA